MEHTYHFAPLKRSLGNDDWFERAACRGEDVNLFFPNRGDYRQAQKAVAVCKQCPVQQKCLDYALKFSMLPGVWGGTTEKQRRSLKRGLRDNAW